MFSAVKIKKSLLVSCHFYWSKQLWAKNYFLDYKNFVMTASSFCYRDSIFYVNVTNFFKQAFYQTQALSSLSYEH